MSVRRLIGLASLIITGFLILPYTRVEAQQSRGSRVAIDQDDIGGVVSSAKGPEAGVWVIAETTDLPTKFVRIVVTDDQGRFVLPDLPMANYQVFVRGYGLVDSPRQSAKPGQHLDLKAEVAPDARAAAQVYPSAWWLSMLNLPGDKEFQKKFTMDMKECYDCHQVGNQVTREISPKSAPGATSTADAWDRRTKVGPSGPAMGNFFLAIGPQRSMFADWTDRIAKGEAPKIAPPRPAGVERNLVITEWDWGTPKDGRSDDAASDTRNPRVNANGLVYGASEMTDIVTVLDPVQNKSDILKVPTEAPVMNMPFNASPTPSPYWGPNTWSRRGDPRSVAIDGKGRVWVAVRGRENQKQPPWCGANGNKFGKFYPMRQSGRQLAVYDPKTHEWGVIDTCFSADHNQISDDNFIYFGVGSAIAWVDINTWDKTHDSEASQGWCPGILDTNGNGKIDPGWTEPNEPVDPTKDHRITFGAYSITISAKDGALWVSGIGRGDKRLVRVVKGSNPPESCRTEFFEPPPNQAIEVIGSGGVDSDSHGVVWQNWRASGHFASFDRSKCKTTADPKVTGQSCPEGWTFYRMNDPTYGNSVYHANESYLTHMDFHDALGLGKDVPMYGSVNTDAIEVLNPQTKQFVTLRVPYPMGFFPRSANGRIDDPKAGWKGRGLWADYASYAGWHREGGPGSLPKAVKFQMRPNPLAK
ncbi:MAG TPA: carboxypeptidase-like regulatory domain-containing protein [Bryobacteraceae bacterium]|nr:carboxypeptidase-like regulatory domain-containing protein [Bryobacteraceae bacterium]